MPLIKMFDDRMTVNIQSEKKKKLEEIAADKKISGSRLVVLIIDEWLKNRESNGRTN